MVKHLDIEITVRGCGVMKAELWPEYAPATVKNFLSLVEK